jgi:hypothetical protein
LFCVAYGRVWKASLLSKKTVLPTATGNSFTNSRKSFFLVFLTAKAVLVISKLLFVVRTLQQKPEGNWALKRHKEIKYMGSAFQSPSAL